MVKIIQKENKLLQVYFSKLISQANLKCISDINATDLKYEHIIITPDRSTLITEQLLFETHKENCFFNVNVTTFTRFANDVINKTVKQNRKLLTKPSAVALIKKIILENKDNLLAFKKSANFSGVATSIFETISMFKSCKVTPDKIDTNTKSVTLNNKLKDIQLIYNLYEQYLQTEYTDSFNKLDLASQVIKDVNFKNTYFYFVGFNNFTTLQYNIITELIKHAKSVAVTCSAVQLHEKVNNKNLYTNKTFLDLKSYSELLGYDISYIDANQQLEQIKEHLKNNLFAYSFEKLSLNNDVNNLKIINFNTPSQEIEFIAKTIYSNVINGKKFKDFTIITPSIDTYKNQIFNEFKKYNIPYFLDINSNFNETVFMRFYTKLFACINYNFLSANVYSFLKVLDIVPYDKVNIYETLINKCGLNGREILKPLNYKTISISEDLNEVYEFLGQVLNFSNNIKGNKTISEFLDELNAFTNSVGFLNHYEKLLQRLYSENNIVEYKTLQQVPLKFEKACVEFRELLGSYICDFETFSQIFTTFFENVTLSLPPLENDVVFVADSVKSFIKPNEFVFVLGANAGSLPYSLDDLGIITDSEMSQMQNAEILQPTVNFTNKVNKYLLFEKLLSFKNELVVSYLNSNSDNEKLMPSTFVTSIRNMFEVNGKTLNDYNGSYFLNYGYYLSNDKYNKEQNLIFNNLSFEMVKQNFAEDVNDWSYFAKNDDYKVKINSIAKILNETSNKLNAYLNNVNYKNEFEKIENAKQLFFEKGTSSVSQFERYFTCPFNHFIEYGLKLHESEDANINPQDFGNIIHEFASLIMPVITKNKLQENANEIILEYCEKLTQEIFSNEKYELLVNSPYNVNVIKSLKNELKRISIKLLEEQLASNFAPKDNYLEMYFGNFEKPIYIGNKESSVKLVGVIDRVDVFDNKFRVIDYKTGGTLFKNYTEIISGKKLQLFVYVYAFYNKTGFKPVGAFYLPIKNDYTTEDKELFKFSGVVANDISIVINMDNSLIQPNTKSKYLNVATKQDGNFNGKVGKNQLISESDILWISKYAITLMNVAYEKIISGDITPRPIKTDKTDTYEYEEIIGISNFSLKLGNEFRLFTNVSQFSREVFISNLNNFLNSDTHEFDLDLNLTEKQNKG